MEQIRLIIAIALSLIVFLLWSVFFGKTPPQPPEQETQTTQTAQSTAEEKRQPAVSPETGTAAVPVTGTAPQPAAVVAPVGREPRKIEVDTPLYRAVISEKGADFNSFVLKNYRETIEDNAPPKELVPQDNGMGTVLFSMKNQALKGLKQGFFTAEQTEDNLSVTDQQKSLAFSWRDEQGVVVEKRYTFSPETYLIQLDVTIKNGSAVAVTDQPVLALSQKRAGKKRSFGFQGPSVFVNDQLEQIKDKDAEENPGFTGKVQWVAVESQYFISSIIPNKPIDSSSKVVAKDEWLENQMIYPTVTVPSGTQQTINATLFLGPKSLKLLKTFDNNLDKAIDFGWFTVIAKPCLYFMNFIHGFIPNYGVAIIVLTIFTKILLWPLGTKSYKSMNDMKKLQPLMAEIREKYKSDKKMMNQELMGLYRTYKINPMGGCLPMVLQIPVFFALYRMLYQAIELRHAPFMLWINDLSAPDRLFRFDFAVPFMEPPFGIPVLTLVMGASMLLQQKMSPAPGDPAQAKMMMIMPIVFTFIFINFSSGLVLYWLVSNIISMAQQYYIQKKYA